MINREPIVVYYRSPKMVKLLRKMGHLTYYHRKRHYAIIYVDAEQKATIIKDIRNLRGVKYVDESHLDRDMYAFDLNVQ